MRPLPPSKTHGIIHSVKVTQQDLGQIADQLKIPPGERKRLRPGDEIHIVREAHETELNRNKK